MITELLSPPKFVRAAIKAAKKNTNHESYKLAALIVQKGKVISVGINYQNKTHPMIQEVHKHKTIHAELNAIVRTVNKDLLKGSTVVVYREDKDGKPAMSRPCVTCQFFLNKYGIKKMLYTNAKGTWTEEILPEYNFDLFFRKCVQVAERSNNNYRDQKISMTIIDKTVEVKTEKGDLIFLALGKNVSDISQIKMDYMPFYSHVMEMP